VSVRRLARIGLVVGLALQLATASVRAEGPLEAKLFAVGPDDVGGDWTAERERDDGDLYQVVYARPGEGGEPPMASLTIGLAASDVDLDGLLAGTRDLSAATGYTFEPPEEVGDRTGWRGTIHRPGVAGTIYVFAVGQAVVYAAVLGPPELEAEVDETASLLARAQEQRLPRA
jgi:hypothetical protein